MGFTPQGRVRLIEEKSRDEDYEEAGPCVGSPLSWEDDPDEED